MAALGWDRLPQKFAASLLKSLAFMAVVGLVPGCSAEQSDQSGIAPAERLVLVTIDTLRYDRFGGPQSVMPRLAEAAKAGLSFEKCFAVTPVTQPTHATLLTGLQPWEHGVTRNGQVLSSAFETLAERLSTEGFATGAVVASFPLEHRFGFARGFDTFVDEFTEARPKKTVRWDGIKPDWKHFYSLADEVGAQALQLIEQLPPGRQFLWVHFYDPHSPYGDSRRDGKPTLTTKQLGYAAQDEDLEKLGKALEIGESLYDSDVSAVDRALGKILDRLASDGIKTHVVVTADHGESFGADGSFGHGDRVTVDQLHVPLVVISPDVEAGVRSEVCGTLDIHRTLLSLVGLSEAERGAGRGRARDLLQPAQGTSSALGMRRTYLQDTEEVRADGSTVSLSGTRFYWAQGDSLFAGNSAEIDGPDNEALAQDLRRAFGVFEAQLESGMAADLTDDDTRAALKELGYVR
ncbi:MAG: arylsulfatase A-like enzyme [Pseudohongiellaceae bacterium]|jgi:arylsulfatase A-like enzyme